MNVHAKMQVHQMLACIGAPEREIDVDFFCAVAQTLYSWAHQSVGDILMIPQEVSTIDSSDGATEAFLGCIYKPEEFLFSMQLVVPEPARRTEMELRYDGGRLAIGTKDDSPEWTMCRSAGFRPPEFILALSKEFGLWDIRKLEPRPWRVTEADVPTLASFLASPDRQLPVLCVSQAKNPGVGDNGYLLRSWPFAKKLFLRAHVIELEWDIARLLSQELGGLWGCYDSAARIYWPGGIDFFSDDPYMHPLYTRWTLYDLGRDAEELLLKEFKNLPTRELPFQAHGILFYMDTQQARLAELRSAVDDTQEYKRQMLRVYEAMREYRALAEDYHGDVLISNAENEELSRQVSALSALVARQRDEISRLRNGVQETVPTDLGYESLGAWAERYYPDRLVLLPRALRALKDAVYRNPSMVCRCLVLLAEEYTAYRLASISREEFLSRCRAVDPGLQESETNSDVSAGEQGKEFFVSYKGRPRKLDRHLKKGSSHNPQYCLRIYFFWDADASVVVVGSLPGHLHTNET